LLLLCLPFLYFIDLKKEAVENGMVPLLRLDLSYEISVNIRVLLSNTVRNQENGLHQDDDFLDGEIGEWERSKKHVIS